MKTPNLDKAKEIVGKQIVDGLKKAAKDDEFSASGNLDRSFGYEKIAEGIKFMAEEYAGALSDGIDNKRGGGDEMIDNIVKWARSKGMRPMTRTSKGRFKKVTDNSYKRMARAIAFNIAQKGISKRNDYKGSGFIDRVITEQKEKVSEIILEAYKKDLLNNIE